MDEAVFLWFNSWNGRYAYLDFLINLLDEYVFKSMPFILVFWGLWFWPKTPEDRTRLRERLTAALVCSAPIIMVTRALANYTPYSARPIHTPGLEISLQEDQFVGELEGWSSMPSDHASLFMGFAVAILVAHRSAGLFLMLWAILIVSIPRIVYGLHWPSDILVGWLVGATTAMALIGPLTKLVRKSRIVPFFEAREMIGYPVLFFASFEFVRMFHTSRTLVEILLS